MSCSSWHHKLEIDTFSQTSLYVLDSIPPPKKKTPLATASVAISNKEDNDRWAYPWEREEKTLDKGHFSHLKCLGDLDKSDRN